MKRLRILPEMCASTVWLFAKCDVEHRSWQHRGDSSLDLDRFVLAHKNASASRHRNYEGF